MVAAADPVPLVIGLGNAHRHDDRCGLDVARGLRRVAGIEARIVEGGDDATALLDLWEGAGRVFVVDAIRSGRSPGTVHRFEVDPARPDPGIPTTSTHGLSLSEAIGLGRALDRLPGRLIVYGIEAGDLSTGTGLTTAVATGVTEATRRIADEIADDLGGRHA